MRILTYFIWKLVIFTALYANSTFQNGRTLPLTCRERYWGNSCFLIYPAVLKYKWCFLGHTSPLKYEIPCKSNHFWQRYGQLITTDIICSHLYLFSFRLCFDLIMTGNHFICKFLCEIWFVFLNILYCHSHPCDQILAHFSGHIVYKCPQITQKQHILPRFT